MCGFIPLISLDVYNGASGRVSQLLDDCFIFSTAHPEKYQVITWYDDPPFPHDLSWMLSRHPQSIPAYGTDQAGAKWPCQTACIAEDYWTGGKHACNEEINAANWEVNAHNAWWCGVKNSELGPYPTPEDVFQKQQEFEAIKRDCINAVSDEYLEAYCSELINSASTVADLKALYTLDDNPGYLIIPDYAFDECLSSFCQVRYEEFHDTWEADARNACYEWSDPIGCLDALCGPPFIDLNETDARENYFESVQCRRHFIEWEGNLHFYFTASENTGKCEQDYADCVNAQAFQEWWDARAQGECALEDPKKALYQRFALHYLDDVGYDTTLEDLMNQFSHVELGPCEAKKLLCEETKGFAVDILSQFVAVSEFPKPETPFRQSTKYMDRVTRRYADHIADTDGSGIPGLTPKQAIRQITQPANLWSLSRAVGMDALFAVLGSNERVFGCDTASSFNDSNVAFPFDLTPAQEELVPDLAAIKDTRLRIDSDDTYNLLELIAVSAPEDLFEFMQNIYSAPSIEDVNAALDELGLIIISTQACCSPGGECSQVTPAVCLSTNGFSLGPGTTCDTAACPIPTDLVACCLEDGACVNVPYLVCTEELSPPGTPIVTAACLGDSDGNGTDDLCEPR
jgi:hypothetical protein